ncbi:hypothetical protein SALBM135S_00207 [Streptomyces alboniger]
MGDGDGRKAAGEGLNIRVEHGSWRVRLRRWAASGSGDVLGAGVLFGGDRVLTCAHVVRDPATGQRPDRVQVEFPLLQGLTRTPCRTATVEAGHWVPPFGKAQGDLAVLVLDEPAPCRRRSRCTARWTTGAPPCSSTASPSTSRAASG